MRNYLILTTLCFSIVVGACSTEQESGPEMNISVSKMDLRELDLSSPAGYFGSQYWITTDVFNEITFEFEPMSPHEYWHSETIGWMPSHTTFMIEYAGSTIYTGEVISDENFTMKLKDNEGSESIYLFSHYSKDKLKVVRTQNGYSKTYLISPQ